MLKRILFLATDPVERESIRSELAASETGWEKLLAGTFDEAVAAIQARPVDAIVADYQPEDPSGPKLLNWAAERLPRSPRLILAEPAEREEVLRAVLASHQFLPKPVTPEVLKGTIESAWLLDGAMPSEVLLTLASRIRVFPPLPSLYFRVLNELKSPDFSPQAVGEIVAKDLAMTTRLLQVINSGFYSLPRRITDLTEAVSLLGQETVKSLIIGIHLFLEHEHLKPLYFSISQLWRHSTGVARSAWLIAQMETGHAERTEEAYTAGLLHDIGKLVLANNFEAQYNKVQKAARDSHRPLWEVETEEFGVSHAELGAFIMGRWGMPVALLEATALHHQPGRSVRREFSALTAVHVANALEYELRGQAEGNVASELDHAYIGSLGLADRIDRWRECVRSGKVPSQGKPVSKPAATAPAAPMANPATPIQAAEPTRNRKWVMAAAAGAAALALLSWYLRQQPGNGSLPARAKTPDQLTNATVPTNAAAAAIEETAPGDNGAPQPAVRPVETPEPGAK